MQGAQVHVRRAVTAVTALFLATLLLAGTFAGAAHARPAAPSPAPTPSPSTSTTPGLALTVDVGVLHIGLTVPLTVPDLLGGRKAPVPATTQPSVTPPTTSTSTSRTVHTAPASRTGVPPYPPTPPKPSRPAGQPSATPPAPVPTQLQPPTQRPTSPHSSSKSKGALVFVKRLIPSDVPAILLLLCVICAIGVAVVVKLSGGRRRL